MIDFESLIEKCQNRGARSLIAEAVRSYHAGAFRGAIVLCWNSLVVDYEEKLKLLQMTGDHEASTKIETYISNKKSGNFQECNRFEDGLLESAVAFEIISVEEKCILSRIKSDRNKCAHPGFLPESDESVVLPELARAHLVSALKLFLTRSPYYSLKAKSIIENQINLELFGQNLKDWKKWLESSGLVHIRENAIESLAQLFVAKAISSPEPFKSKYKNVLKAFLELDNTRWATKSIEKAKTIFSKCHAENSNQQGILYITAEIDLLKQSLDGILWTWIVGSCKSSSLDLELWSQAARNDELRETLMQMKPLSAEMIRLAIKHEHVNQGRILKFLIDQYIGQRGYKEAYQKGLILAEYCHLFDDHPQYINYMVDGSKSSPGDSIHGSDYYRSAIFAKIASHGVLREKLITSFTQHQISGILLPQDIGVAGF